LLHLWLNYQPAQNRAVSRTAIISDAGLNPVAAIDRPIVLAHAAGQDVPPA